MHILRPTLHAVRKYVTQANTLLKHIHGKTNFWEEHDAPDCIDTMDWGYDNFPETAMYKALFDRFNRPPLFKKNEIDPDTCRQAIAHILSGYTPSKYVDSNYLKTFENWCEHNSEEVVAQLEKVCLYTYTPLKYCPFATRAELV